MTPLSRSTLIQAALLNLVLIPNVACSPTCHEISAEHRAIVREAQEGRLTCETDEDCTLVRESFECGTISLGSCWMPLRADARDAFESEVDAQSATLCESAMESSGCGVYGVDVNCSSTEARCREGVCVAEPIR